MMTVMMTTTMRETGSGHVVVADDHDVDVEFAAAAAADDKNIPRGRNQEKGLATVTEPSC